MLAGKRGESKVCAKSWDGVVSYLAAIGCVTALDLESNRACHFGGRECSPGGREKKNEENGEDPAGKQVGILQGALRFGAVH